MQITLSSSITSASGKSVMYSVMIPLSIASFKAAVSTIPPLAKLRSLAPVSYTHLDVYKRQLLHNHQFQPLLQVLRFFQRGPLKLIRVQHHLLPRCFQLFLPHFQGSHLRLCEMCIRDSIFSFLHNAVVCGTYYLIHIYKLFYTVGTPAYYTCNGKYRCCLLYTSRCV